MPVGAVLRSMRWCWERSAEWNLWRRTDSVKLTIKRAQIGLDSSAAADLSGRRLVAGQWAFLTVAVHPQSENPYQVLFARQGRFE